MTLCASWTWCLSFDRLGKFSAIIFLNNFSAPYHSLLLLKLQWHKCSIFCYSSPGPWGSVHFFSDVQIGLFLFFYLQVHWVSLPPPPKEWKSQPPSAFSDTTLVERRGTRYNPAKMEVWHLHSAFPQWQGGTSYSVVFSWNSATVIQKFPALLGWSLSRTAQDLGSILLFLVCPHRCFWASGFFKSKFWIYKAKRKSRGLTILLFLRCWDPSQSAFCAYFRVSLREREKKNI